MLYVTVFSTILLVAIISSIISHASYKDLVLTNLDESMEFSIKMLQVNNGVGITSEMDSSGNFSDYLGGSTPSSSISFGNTDNANLKSDFIKYLTMNLNQKVDKLDIKIYGADADDGILSAEVIATFTYPSGQQDTVSSYRTVILDKYVKTAN